MDRATWPRLRNDLASTRRSAAAFLETLDGSRTTGGTEWFSRWIEIGDAHGVLGDAKRREGKIDEAAKAWLCALTAFEIAKRLAGEQAVLGEDVSSKIGSAIETFGSLKQRIERVQIECYDQSAIEAHYLPADGYSRAPAIICISAEDETSTKLLGRLLPAAAHRGMSVLAVTYDDVSDNRRGHSSEILSCCLDYLSTRDDVDVTRIGVYGDTMGAALATDLAVSDSRVAAAVCDGGLWSWARTMAAVEWVSGVPNTPNDDLIAARRLRLLRQLKCPVLVVAGGRGIASASEAIELQNACAAGRMDVQLIISPSTMTDAGEIDNFVICDDRIFGWLEQRLR
ncbi:dienelactone hydrolase family protein [Bradyrhizobium sp. 153]|uniref:alpha/beta hydrolase n=1 Tax=Bradyrhizobium sp. 153 TaxID=2782627 RepID=UPI001FF99A5F|nr:dienelactone hydrolase family protein [Bradyrhizobium sp. 153]MCK1667924.1 dienelactone hydrolase family protein [Bradyrhizobium sp. 153]